MRRDIGTSPRNKAVRTPVSHFKSPFEILTTYLEPNCTVLRRHILHMLALSVVNNCNSESVERLRDNLGFCQLAPVNARETKGRKYTKAMQTATSSGPKLLITADRV